MFGAMTLLNLINRLLIGLFTPGAIIGGTKKQRFILSCVSIFFFLSLHNEMGHPIRFDLKSRARNSCCCTKSWEWTSPQQRNRVLAIDALYTVHYIYIYVFSRRFYPKWLTVHSGYTFFIVSMCVPWEVAISSSYIHYLPLTLNVIKI